MRTIKSGRKGGLGEFSYFECETEAKRYVGASNHRSSKELDEICKRQSQGTRTDMTQEVLTRTYWTDRISAI